MNKELLISAIQQGTVIDHLPKGSGLLILRYLRLGEHVRVMLGMNLPSKRIYAKDLIKIEGHLLTQKESELIAVFAPKATINLIEKENVVSKYTVTSPKRLEGILRCPNTSCITREGATSRFDIVAEREPLLVRCVFCSHIFNREEFIHA